MLEGWRHRRCCRVGLDIEDVGGDRGVGYRRGWSRRRCWRVGGREDDRRDVVEVQKRLEVMEV